MHKICAGQAGDFFVLKGEVGRFWLAIRLVYDIIRLLWRFFKRE